MLTGTDSSLIRPIMRIGPQNLLGLSMGVHGTTMVDRDGPREFIGVGQYAGRDERIAKGATQTLVTHPLKRLTLSQLKFSISLRVLSVAVVREMMGSP